MELRMESIGSDNTIGLNGVGDVTELESLAVSSNAASGWSNGRISIAHFKLAKFRKSKMKTISRVKSKMCEGKCET